MPGPRRRLPRIPDIHLPTILGHGDEEVIIGEAVAVEVSGFHETVKIQIDEAFGNPVFRPTKPVTIVQAQGDCPTVFGSHQPLRPSHALPLTHVVPRVAFAHQALPVAACSRMQRALHRLQAHL